MGSSILNAATNYLDYHDYRRHREDSEGWRINVGITVDQEQPRIQLSEQRTKNTARDSGQDRNDARCAQRYGRSRSDSSWKEHVMGDNTGHPDLQKDQRRRRHAKH
jgi:hypothetical protein